MFKIAIVDDEAPARMRLRTLLDDIAHEFPHEVVAETGDAQEALRLMQSVKPDVILLDVQMPVMTGIEFAKALRAASGEGARPQIIYITAYEEFALPAFEVQATDYLLKPVRASRLLESLRRVRARLPQPEAGAEGAGEAPQGQIENALSMQDIEPFYNWRDYYVSEDDEHG